MAEVKVDSAAEVRGSTAAEVQADHAMEVKTFAGSVLMTATSPSEVDVDGAAEVKVGNAVELQADHAVEVKVGNAVDVQADPAVEIKVGNAMEIQADHAVEVKTLAGSVLTTVTPVPRTTRQLKEAVESQAGRQALTQKIVMCDGLRVLEDEEELPQEPLEVFCLTDETPQWSWDRDGNPGAEDLQVEGPRLTCPSLSTDWNIVVTKAPLLRGRHYFEFVMHQIGDEQWCGVLDDPSCAGSRCHPRWMKGWTYYCGRVGWTNTSGTGALRAQMKSVMEFERLSPHGDVIGMLVDLDLGAIAFARNGKLQGASPIAAGTPLWVVTVVDRPGDDVELRKPLLEDALPENLEALTGALLSQQCWRSAAHLE